jgi:general secretion pathway protein E
VSQAISTTAMRVEPAFATQELRLAAVPADREATAVVHALVNQKFISKTDIKRVEKVRAESTDERTSLEYLVGLGLVSDQDLALTIATTLNLQRLESADLGHAAEAPVTVSYRFLKQHCVVPVTMPENRVVVAMLDPCQGDVVDGLRLCFGPDLGRAVATRSDIERAIEQHYGTETTTDESAPDDEDDLADLDVEQLKDMASEAPVIRLVNQLLQQASEASASDIHIEPFEGQLKVRYRIDGVLHDSDSPPQSLAAAIVSRIKIMAKLNIAERRLPQDGRTKLRIQGSDIDARVSTIPTMHGESVVLRLLNRGDVKLDLGSLGFSESTRESFLDLLRQPNGMILVTGPTGSGKTTTLYTAIDLLNTEQRKIITAEDPVEYQMEGVNQIQVKPAIGLTFSQVLRSIVRQDPDVILVGEMRDIETARICVQSALTGHLVLSTLHTNSAASSVARLMEMGIEEYLLTSTLNGVLSQRLVRKLCNHCKEPYSPTRDVVDELGLREVAECDDIVLHRPVGCDSCNDTGYRGRLSILELLTMNDEVRALVSSRSDSRQIEKAAIQGGMRTIYHDGCVKALAGTTSMDEVLRVIQDG